MSHDQVLRRSSLLRQIRMEPDGLRLKHAKRKCDDGAICFIFVCTDVTRPPGDLINDCVQPDVYSSAIKMAQGFNDPVEAGEDAISLVTGDRIRLFLGNTQVMQTDPFGTRCIEALYKL